MVDIVAGGIETMVGTIGFRGARSPLVIEFTLAPQNAEA
jgi:hypothetical protein